MFFTNSKRKLSPLKIALIYTFTGGLWVILSGNLTAALFLEPTVYKRVDALNHGSFIFITAWMLYILIRQSETIVTRPQESLRRLNRSLKAYSECNQALIRATDELQFMHEVCRTFVEVGGYRLAWVGIAEHDGGKTVRPVASWGDEQGYLDSLEISWGDIDLGRGPTGTAIRTGKPQVSQHILYDPRWELWREKALQHGFAASISLPLRIEERPVGALVIFASEPSAFDQDEVKLLMDLAGDLSYGIKTLRMNAERKKVEQERKLLASVIEQSMEGIILFDSGGLIQYVNPAVATITGQTPAAMVGSNIHTLQREDPGREFYKTIWTAICRGNVRTGHFIHSGSNGTPHEIESTIWSILDGTGTVSNYAVLIRDVTHEVQLERQLRQAQRMEAIGTLAGGIAHDFNNNLASIITCSEMARDDVPEESPLRELLDVILKSAYRGRNLVKQILTFSCQGEQERQPVQAELVVHECLKLLRASVPASIKIQQRIDNNLGMVMADPTQIHQIVMNLCTNAAHAMRDKGGILEIGLANADLDTAAVSGFPDLPSGCYLKLTVKDTGHGMDRKTMERIFDPFFTTKGHIEGTGLGLSVVHGIVKNHGGTITVNSEAGKGATFDVFLPRIDNTRTEAEGDAAASATGGSERILFVDDEEDVVFSGKRMLERLGYDVVACLDGNEALEVFRSDPQRFDLVITDQNMPNMNGTELSRKILSIRADMPVILCTGYAPGAGGSISAQDERASGIRERAMKPLDRGEMAGMIRRVLSTAA
jgi:PAS domain S-box-containing protein